MLTQILVFLFQLEQNGTQVCGWENSEAFNKFICYATDGCFELFQIFTAILLSPSSVT